MPLTHVDQVVVVSVAPAARRLQLAHHGIERLDRLGLGEAVACGEPARALVRYWLLEGGAARVYRSAVEALMEADERMVPDPDDFWDRAMDLVGKLDEERECRTDVAELN